MKDSRRNRERAIRDAIYRQQREIEQAKLRRIRHERSSKSKREQRRADNPLEVS